MEILRTTLPGCHLILSPPAADRRGSFTKVFLQSAFEQAGLETGFREMFFTRSRRGVLRGLHFQAPPHDHAKLVFVSEGEVFDVVLDLRVGSPTFGAHEAFRLDGAGGGALYIPRGLAHGFCVVGDGATMAYCVTSEHVPTHDRGIRWDSAGIPWPVKDPLTSERDGLLPPFPSFQSPFRYP